MKVQRTFALQGKLATEGLLAWPPQRDEVNSQNRKEPKTENGKLKTEKPKTENRELRTEN